MPNPKVGTVTPDVARAVKNAKAGQVQYRADKAGIVHCTIGRASFTPEQLQDNLVALIDALNKAKPAATQGHVPEEGRGVDHDGASASKVDPRVALGTADDFGPSREWQLVKDRRSPQAAKRLNRAVALRRWRTRRQECSRWFLIQGRRLFATQ